MKPSTHKGVWPEWNFALGSTEIADRVSRLIENVYREQANTYPAQISKHGLGEGKVFVFAEGQIGEPAEARQVEALAVEDEIKRVFISSQSGTIAQPSEPSHADLVLAISNFTALLSDLGKRVSRIESTLNEVVKGVERLREQQPCVWVPIQSFAPEPYDVLKPFAVVVTVDGEEFEASFFDANLYGSGDTEEEAISDLKAVVIESLDRLSELEDDKLGPAMLKQKRVLTAHIRRIV